MPPRAVLLDLYDTLVDGDWHGWRTELSALTGIDEDTLGMAYHLTREERNTGAYPTSEDSVRALLGAAGLAAPTEDLVHAVVQAEEAFGGEIRLYDDSLPTVAAFRERGDRTALVSNCSHATRPIVEQLGLPALFDAVILSFEVRRPQARARHLPGRADGAGRRSGRRRLRRRSDGVLRRSPSARDRHTADRPRRRRAGRGVRALDQRAHGHHGPDRAPVISGSCRCPHRRSSADPRCELPVVARQLEKARVVDHFGSTSRSRYAWPRPSVSPISRRTNRSDSGNGIANSSTFEARSSSATNGSPASTSSCHNRSLLAGTTIQGSLSDRINHSMQTLPIAEC